MRFLTSVGIILMATTLCCRWSISHGHSELDPNLMKHLTRRAIDGTRGRKYYDPKDDGFFDEFGYDKGLYRGDKEDYSDLRSNVPGEPGVDYPALVKIPRTSFSCYGRGHGYFADEETGCQVFHLCDSGYATSFLCPVGSLFNQRFLTCDWWTKVSCSRSHEFHSLQSFQGNEIVYEPDQESELSSSVVVHANAFEQNYKGKHRKVQEQRKDKYYKDESFTRKVESTDSPLIRISPVMVQEKRGREFSTPRSSSHSTVSTTKQLSSQFVEKNNVGFLSSVRPFRTSIAATEEHVSSTTASYEPSLSESEDTVNSSTLTLVPEKKFLEDVTDQKINKFSAVDSEDMELKESINLVKSHVERKFEKEEEVATVTEVSEEEVEMTTLEAISDKVTPIVDVDITTLRPQQQDESFETKESIDANESINEVRSKVGKKLQFFDNEKESVTKSLEIEDKQEVTENIKSTEESVKSEEETVNPFEESVTSEEETVNSVEESVKSEEETVNPVEESVKSEEETVNPFEENVKSEEETVNPVEESVKSEEETVNPVEESVKSEEETVNPVEESIKSEEETVNPVEESVKSEEETVKPFEENTQLNEETVKPVEENMKMEEETVKPFIEIMKLEKKTIKPVEENVKSEEEAVKSDTEETVKSEAETVKSDIEKNVVTITEQAEVEKSTLLPSTEESTEAATVFASSEKEEIPATSASRSEVRKMSGFLINVPENQIIEETTKTFKENNSTETQESLNSSETSSTSADAFISTQKSEEQSTVSSSESKTALDTAEESNAPQVVTVSLNFADVLPSDFINQEIIQNNKPADLENPEIAQSEVQRDLVFDQNQRHFSPTPKVRTYQNIRFHYNRDDNQENVEPQSTILTLPYVSTSTQVPYQELTSPQSIVSKGHNYNENFISSSTYTDIPSTTHAPRIRYDDENETHEGRRNLRNQQRRRQQTYRNRITKVNDFVSSTAANYEEDDKVIINHKNQPEEPQTFNYPSRHQEQRRKPHSRSRNNQVHRNRPNYQTHNYPETISRQVQHTTAENYPTNFYAYTTTPTYVRSEFRSIPHFMTPSNESIKNNYDYQHYDTADDIDVNIFEDFGTKLSSRNRQRKPVNRVTTEKPKLKESTNNAQTINSELEGKNAVDFLYTMSQLVKNDRAPRPFVRNEVGLNFYNQANLNYRNSQRQQNIGTNYDNDFSNFRQKTYQEPSGIDIGSVNYNNGDSEYTVEVDDFAAPKFIAHTTEKSKLETDPRLITRTQNEKNIEANGHRVRQEKILNNKVPAISEARTTAAFKIPNAPKINVLSLNQNQQFVQIPHPVFSVSNVENARAFDKSTRVQSNAQTLNYSPQTSSEPTYEESDKQTFNTQVRLEDDYSPIIPGPVISAQAQISLVDNKFNVTTSKTTVETEFIPSISFDLGSDQGRMEYLDALQKGIVTSDGGSRHAKNDDNTSASMKVKERSDESRSSTISEVSDVMDNFKDMSEVMKGTE